MFLEQSPYPCILRFLRGRSKRIDRLLGDMCGLQTKLPESLLFQTCIFSLITPQGLA